MQGKYAIIECEKKKTALQSGASPVGRAVRHKSISRGAQYVMLHTYILG
jgi:hypothetical protein